MESKIHGDRGSFVCSLREAAPEAILQRNKTWETFPMAVFYAGTTDKSLQTRPNSLKRDCNATSAECRGVEWLNVTYLPWLEKKVEATL